MEDSRVEAEAATNALSVLKKTLKGEKSKKGRSYRLVAWLFVTVLVAMTMTMMRRLKYSAKPRVTPHFVLACI